jgi:DNA-binding NarL/FixJ family response regulator
MPGPEDARPPRHAPRPLSALERDILQLVEQGMSVREIAYYLAIDPRLVRARLRNLIWPARSANAPWRARPARA